MGTCVGMVAGTRTIFRAVRETMDHNPRSTSRMGLPLSRRYDRILHRVLCVSTHGIDLSTSAAQRMEHLVGSTRSNTQAGFPITDRKCDYRNGRVRNSTRVRLGGVRSSTHPCSRFGNPHSGCCRAFGRESAMDRRGLCARAGGVGTCTVSAPQPRWEFVVVN